MDFGEWLKGQGLERLEPTLRSAGIDLDILAEISDQDLAAIGMTLGDRKRFLRAARGSPPSIVAVVQAADNLLAGVSKPILAERRHLTVLFCDLVGSTGLATRFDPEDLRQIIDTYHRAIVAAVTPYAGHIAQFLGDGVLVYFGYPAAHEDDGDRAARAALAVQEVVTKLRPHQDLQLRARIGIASGLVVVGAVGTGTLAAEQSASGETPNLAARLQGSAKPGEIFVSSETHRLLGASFETEPVGLLDLKGFEAPTAAWRVLSERREASRFESQHTNLLSQFVGRDSEVSMLLERWEMARDAEGQVILLSGEAGIGKSRISQALRVRLAGESFRLLVLQCSPYFAGNALYPIVQHLERAAQIKSTDLLPERTQKLEQYLSDFAVDPAWISRLLKLLGLPGGIPLPTQESTQRAKEQTLRAIVESVICIAEQEAVLLLVEDAHWIDPTTDELLGLAIERFHHSRVMVLITARPEYVPSWGEPAHLTRLALGRLGHRQCAALVNSVTGGRTLPQEVLAEIVKKTDGIPLFVEELTKTIVESGFLKETSNGFELESPLPAIAIPSTLQDSLMARLDRLAPAKEVAQVAAAIGRDFSHGLLAEVMKIPDKALNHALDELIRAELIFGHGGPARSTYTFKHALIRDSAYLSMVRSQRALRHGQIAQALERTSPELASLQPDLLALHHQEAGNVKEAIRCWTAAGDLVWSRSSGREAILHYSNALNLINHLSASLERSEMELRLNLKRGHALFATEGYGSPATYQSFDRALVLADEVGRVDEFIETWAGSAPTLFGRGKPLEVINNLKHLEPFRIAALEEKLQVATMAILGTAYYLIGDLDQAWSSIAKGIALDNKICLTHLNPIGGGDPAVVLRAYGARTRWLQGYLSEGSELAAQSVRIARDRGHAHSIAWAGQTNLAALLLKGERLKVVAAADESIGLSERLGFKTRIATGWLHLGRAKVLLGEVDLGRDLVAKGYGLWASAGGKFHCTEYGAQAALTLLEANLTNDARRFLEDAQAVQETTDERCYEPELLRLSGRIIASDGDSRRAEIVLQQSLAQAEQGGFKLFSLRAATDLAIIMQRQKREIEARDTLIPILNWFTDAFDYPDIIRAKGVLNSCHV